MITPAVDVEHPCVFYSSAYNNTEPPARPERLKKPTNKRREVLPSLRIQFFFTRLTLATVFGPYPGGHGQAPALAPNERQPPNAFFLHEVETLA